MTPLSSEPLSYHDFMAVMKNGKGNLELRQGDQRAELLISGGDRTIEFYKTVDGIEQLDHAIDCHVMLDMPPDDPFAKLVHEELLHHAW